jgi:FkbM family methyltransferase
MHIQVIRRQIRHRVAAYRRHVFEQMGDLRYSRPAWYDMDRILEKYLPERGVFVEAGANDGYSFSNTYYLERVKEWRGVLIEAIPHLYRECRHERRHSQVFNCALVAPDYPKPTISLTYGDVMSIVSDIMRPDDPAMNGRFERLAGYIRETPFEITVPVRTLDSVLEEAGIGAFDFLSLDIEGYELPALRGLDLNRHRPRYMLVEAWDDDRHAQLVTHLSQNGYREIARLGEMDADYLFESTDQ